MKKIFAIALLALSASAGATDRMVSDNCNHFADMNRNDQLLVTLSYLEGVWSMAEEGTIIETIAEHLMDEGEGESRTLFIRTVVGQCKADGGGNAFAIMTEIIGTYVQNIYENQNQ